MLCLLSHFCAQHTPAADIVASGKRYSGDIAEEKYNRTANDNRVCAVAHVREDADVEQVLDQSQRARLAHSLRAIVDAEFAEDIMRVDFDGAGGQHQLRGDFGVR